MLSEVQSREQWRAEVLTELDALDTFYSKNQQFLLGCRSKFAFMTKNPVFAYTESRHLNNNIFKQILFPALLDIEEKAGGSADICLRILSNLLKFFLVHDSVDTEFFGKIDHSIHSLKLLSFASRRRLARDDLLSLAKQIQNASVQKMILRAVELAGAEGQIRLEPSRFANFVKVERGFSYNLNPMIIVDNETWNRKNVRCLMVDGIVEAVSEIHLILEHFHVVKEPLVIFARGFSEEVQNTLHVNMQRKTLDVLPIRVEYDLETANHLKDLAVICGCDVVSSLKGELISTLNPANFVKIEAIKVHQNTVTLFSDNNLAGVKHLINEISQKRQESHLFRSYCDSRLRSLSSYHVVVNVKNFGGIAESQSIVQSDIFLRSLKSCLTDGVLNLKEILKNSGSLSKFLAIDADLVCSSRSFVLALETAVSLTKDVIRTSIVIKEDE